MGCSSSKSTEVTNEAMTAASTAAASTAPAVGKPTLYVDPMAPTCRAVGMVCRLGKIDVDVKVLSILKGEHKTDAMKKLNPVGSLPFLVDGGLKLNDSQSMATYLVRTYASASKLYGDGVEEMAKVDELLTDAKNVYTVFADTLGAVRFGGDGPTDADRMKVIKMVGQIDSRLENKLYNLGNYPTIADAFLYNTLISFDMLTNFHVEYKNMMKWAQRLVEAANFQDIEDQAKAAAAELNKVRPILYWHPLSPPSRAVHMVACHLNVPVELKLIDLPKGEHKKPEYLAIQPTGTVPCMGVKTDKHYDVKADFNIGDSNPIATYLADTYGKKSTIYGSDDQQKARIDEYLAWEAIFRVNMSKFFLNKAFGAPVPTEEQVEKLEDNLVELEARLGDNKFTCGDNVTLVDIFIAETLLQLEMGRGKKVETPNIAKFVSAIESLPYYNFAHKALNEIRPAMKL